MRNSLQALAKPLGPDVTVKQLLPAVLSMSQDPVPNVRFNVAKTLVVIKPFIDQKYGNVLYTRTELYWSTDL